MTTSPVRSDVLGGDAGTGTLEEGAIEGKLNASGNSRVRMQMAEAEEADASAGARALDAWLKSTDPSTSSWQYQRGRSDAFKEGFQREWRNAVGYQVLVNRSNRSKRRAWGIGASVVGGTGMLGLLTWFLFFRKSK